MAWRTRAEKSANFLHDDLITLLYYNIGGSCESGHYAKAVLDDHLSILAPNYLTRRSHLRKFTAAALFIYLISSTERFAVLNVISHPR
jgi:hypothetical protein